MNGFGLEQLEVFYCERAEDVGPSFDDFLRDRIRVVLFHYVARKTLVHQENGMTIVPCISGPIFGRRKYRIKNKNKKK